MKVRYDQSQDLTFILNKEEERQLSKKTKEFCTNPIRGGCKELDAYVFLAYSNDKCGILANASEIDNHLGKIEFPELDGYPLRINLSDAGINFLKAGWVNGVRYNGTNKLFIKVQEL